MINQIKYSHGRHVVIYIHYESGIHKSCLRDTDLYTGSAVVRTLEILTAAMLV